MSYYIISSSIYFINYVSVLPNLNRDSYSNNRSFVSVTQIQN